MVSVKFQFWLMKFPNPRHEDGRFSAYREKELLFDCGVIDTAGSGVVHAVGGIVALSAAVGSCNGSRQGIRAVAHKPDTVRSVGAAASCLKRSHECTELTVACHSGGKHHLDRPATPAVLLLAPR